MKKILTAPVARPLAAIALIALFTGCAGTPADRASGMASKVNGVSSGLDTVRQGITQCLTTLNQLGAQPSGGMVAQYKAYLDSVRSLEAQTECVVNGVNGILAGSETYFSYWDAQIGLIQDPELRQLSANRKQQSLAALSEVKKALDVSQLSWKPLLKGLGDVGTYLGTSLTPEGLAALKPRLESIKLEALKSRESIAGLGRALSAFSATLAAPATPAPLK